MLAPQFQAVCSRCGIISNVMQYHQVFGWDTTPSMSDIDVQNWNYIKWMVTILPPWSSYNLTMVHRSNECVLARHPRDSHTNTRQEQQWRIKCMFQTSLWGVGTPLCFIQKGAPKGGSPPLVSIHKFNVWLPPPYRVGLPQGDLLCVHFIALSHEAKSEWYRTQTSCKILWRKGHLHRCYKWSGKVHPRQPNSPSRDRILLARTVLWKMHSRFNMFR